MNKRAVKRRLIWARCPLGDKESQHKSRKIRGRALISEVQIERRMTSGRTKTNFDAPGMVAPPALDDEKKT